MSQRKKFNQLAVLGGFAYALVSSISSAAAEQAIYLTDQASYCQIFQAISQDIPDDCRAELGQNQLLGSKTRSIQLRQAQQAVSGAAKGNTATYDQDGPRAIAMNIQFEFDSSKLTLAALNMLDRVAEVLKSDLMKDKSIVVEGHTDTIGTETYNLSLSTRRALAVQFYLVEQHLIDMDRLQVSGKGEMEPYDAANPKAPLNRRVEFTNLNS